MLCAGQQRAPHHHIASHYKAPHQRRSSSSRGEGEGGAHTHPSDTRESDTSITSRRLTKLSTKITTQCLPLRIASSHHTTAINACVKARGAVQCRRQGRAKGCYPPENSQMITNRLRVIKETYRIKPAQATQHSVDGQKQKADGGRRRGSVQ